MKNGILLVDKPQGWTSFDVLVKLRGVLGTRKLGHSGTLDPMATGVLAVFVGRATAAADRQLNHDKTYEATVRLGIRTDTGDITGTVLENAPVTVGEQAFTDMLPRFVGTQQQLPPMYSAVKINGQPLYKAARAGKTVERIPREITVYSIDYLGTAGENEYRIRVACSKGTYIRTLAEDLGGALGVPATLSGLRRTAAGVFDLSGAHTMEQLLEAAQNGGVPDEWILGTDTVFAPLPALKVAKKVRLHLFNGCPTSHYPAPDGRYRVYGEDETFLGLACITGGVLNVEKLFCERE